MKIVIKLTKGEAEVMADTLLLGVLEYTSHDHPAITKAYVKALHNDISNQIKGQL